MSTGFYEQIKADLGYLHLDAAASSFAVLAEEARTATTSPPPASQASPTKPSN